MYYSTQTQTFSPTEYPLTEKNPPMGGNPGRTVSIQNSFIQLITVSSFMEHKRTRFLGAIFGTEGLCVRLEGMPHWIPLRYVGCLACQVYG